MKRYTTAILIVTFLAGCAMVTSPKVDKTRMAEGYYMKALSHLQENNYEMASVEFNRSIQTDSNFKSSYYGLGLISDYQGKLDDSARYYREAIERDGEFSEAYNALGVVYFKQQKWNDALKVFRKALENKLYRTPHVPYLNMGDLYMAQKEYDKAIAAYRDSKRYVNLEITIFKLGTALYEAGKTRDAISEFQEGISIAPQNASIRLSLAVALLKDGNKKAALVQFKKASELAPRSDVSVKANDYIKTLR